MGRHGQRIGLPIGCIGTYLETSSRTGFMICIEGGEWSARISATGSVSRMPGRRMFDV